MKRSLLLLGILIFSHPLSAQELYLYRSNSIGMTLEEIDESETVLHEYYVRLYTLQFEGNISERKKILYKNGEEHGIWIKKFVDERLVQETVELSERREIFDFENARISSWSLVIDDSLKEQWDLLYSETGELLKRIRVYPQDPPAAIIYNLSNDGALRSNIREIEDRTDYVLQGIDRRKYLQWIGTTETGILQSYSNGRISLEKKIDGAKSETWNYSYGEQQYTKTRTADAVTYEEVYNYQDMLISSTIRKEGQRIYYELREYNKADPPLLTAKTVIDKNTRFDWEYVYEVDSLKKENEYRNTELTSVIIYGDEGYVKEIYDEGAVKYILVYDVNGLLVSTDISEGAE